MKQSLTCPSCSLTRNQTGSRDCGRKPRALLPADRSGYLRGHLGRSHRQLAIRRRPTSRGYRSGKYRFGGSDHCPPGKDRQPAAVAEHKAAQRERAPHIDHGLASRKSGTSAGPRGRSLGTPSRPSESEPRRIVVFMAGRRWPEIVDTLGVPGQSIVSVLPSFMGDAMCPVLGVGAMFTRWA